MLNRWYKIAEKLNLEEVQVIGQLSDVGHGFIKYQISKKKTEDYLNLASAEIAQVIGLVRKKSEKEPTQSNQETKLLIKKLK